MGKKCALRVVLATLGVGGRCGTCGSALLGGLLVWHKANAMHNLENYSQNQNIKFLAMPYVQLFLRIDKYIK